jgi:hypothetical protein
MEINETKLEKKLQEIKALLLQLLKHDEHSEPENEIRGIMKLFEFSMKDFLKIKFYIQFLINTKPEKAFKS